MLPQLLFWIPVVVVTWVYLLYPAVAAVAAAIRPFRIRHSLAAPRLVTVGIAVHNEAGDLEERVVNVLGQQTEFELEVVVASDGSTDATDAIAARLAEDDRRIRLLSLPRGGTSAAHNAIFRSARGDVVVLTDAETRYLPGCLDALVAPFRDPRIGCTTGHLSWRNDGSTPTSQQEGLYWRYELAVRGVESRAGWLTAVTGALLALRPDCYRPLPDSASHDQLLPLYARDLGYAVVAVPEARATDRGITSLGQQFRNRARTATRGIRANLAMVSRLTPWRRPSAFLAIWSHKLLRWATPWLALAAVIGAVLLVARGETVYLIPIVLAVALLALAGLGYVLRLAGRRASWAALPLAVVVVNAAFLVGWLNILRGHRLTAWHRAAWRTE